MMRLAENMTSGPKNIKHHLIGEEKIITLGFIILMFVLLNITLSSNYVSALTYQDEVDVSFTFAPTLSISLSSDDLVINDLVPGNYSKSNTIAINVSTNNVYGYTLSAKVGGEGETDASSSLVNTTTNTAFASLASTDNLTLPNFNDNTWGYTTSSSINNSTLYSGLLYDTDTTVNMTKNNSGTALGRFPGTNNTNFTIGAKASPTQLAGDYTNTITFTAVSNMIPLTCNPTGTTINTIVCMQDISSTNKAFVITSMTQDQQYQLIDSRDGKFYNVVKLSDNSVWLAQNLSYIGGSNGAVSAGNAINSAGNSFTMVNSKDDSYVEARYYVSNNNEYGVYYNFCAASGGTICTSSNSDYPSAFICPQNWTLPGLASYGEKFGNTSFEILKNSGIFEVYAGWYGDGKLRNDGVAGYWWSPSRISVTDGYSKTCRYDLYYNGSKMTYDITGRSRLMPVRCMIR